MFLVIGLGSMGRRRIRCLKSLGYDNIHGFDINKARAVEVSEEYSVSIVDNLDSFMHEKRPIVIISTSPESHYEFMNKCYEKDLKFFVEAGVFNDEHRSLYNKNNKLLGVPSSTLSFHPAIKLLKEIVESSELGLPVSFNYYSGQYLPLWHTYEHVKDYYVSKKDTGGAREIFPFELTWICQLFGFPQKIIGLKSKNIDIEGAEEIDDTYMSIIQWENLVGSITVDVVSRIATRKLFLNFQYGSISWDWKNSFIEISTGNEELKRREYLKLNSHDGYNSNISEKMYVDEVESFMKLVDCDEGDYPNNLEFDFNVIKLLYDMERSSDLGKSVSARYEKL